MPEDRSLKAPNKSQPSALRQDLLRGIRWGTILLIVMLLSIAAYRVLSSSPAAASPVAEELAPTPEVAPKTDAAIQVGDAVLKGPDAPAAPKPEVTVKPRRTAAKATPKVIEEPERLHAPSFTPQPVAAAPKPTAKGNAFIAEPLPTPAEAPAPAVAEMPSPSAPSKLAPPPDDSKQGNRAVRAVRSVGRIFRLGRKDPKPAEETK